MKDINKLNDKNQIDLESLNNFLLTKGDNYLDRLIITKTIKKENITKDFFQKNYDLIFEGSKDRSDFNGEDFPAEWYTDDIISDIINEFSYSKCLLFLNSNIKNYYLLCEKTIEKNAYSLVYVPKTIKNYYHLCEKAVLIEPVTLDIVPKTIKNYYLLCEKAVSLEPFTLHIVPEELRDYSICEKAVSNEGRALQYVPENIQDYFICEKAVLQNKDALEFIYDLSIAEEIMKKYKLYEYISKEVRKLLKENDDLNNNNNKLQEKSDVHKIDLESLNKFFIKKNDKLLNLLLLVKEYIIIKNIDEKIFNEYIIDLEKYNVYDDTKLTSYNNYKKLLSEKDTNFGIWRVPYFLRTYELCDIAVSNNWENIKQTPNHLKDYSICEKAVIQNGREAFPSIPEHLKDYNLYKIALTKDGNFIIDVPKNIENYYSLAQIAINSKTRSFYFIDDDVENYYSICKLAVSKDGWNLDIVRYKLRNYELCYLACNSDTNYKLTLISIPKEIENYYSLLKICYEKNREFILKLQDFDNWTFPKEYIPQLIKDFPEDKEELEKILLREYITKEVRKLLKESNELLDNKLQEKSDEHKIDLNSLNNFFLKEGDNYLEALLIFKKYINVNYSNQYIQDYIIEQNLIYNLPAELYNNYDFWYKAVSYQASNIRRVPVNLIDYPLCEKAVSQSGYYLRDIPKKFIDYPLCKKAVSNYSMALADVPKNIDNYYKLVKIAFQNNKFIFHDLEEYEDVDIDKYIPQIIKDFPEDKEFLERYLRKEWLLREYIFKKVRKLLKETLFTKKKLL